MAMLFVSNDARLMVAAYEKESPALLLVVISYALSFVSIIILLRSRVGWVRKVSEIMLFSAIYTDVLFLLIAGYPLSYPDVLNLFNNPEYAPGALATFMLAVLVAFAGAGLLFTLIHFPLKRLSIRFSPYWMFLFIGIQAAGFLISRKMHGIHDFLPSVYRVTGNLLTANGSRPESKWRRQSVVLQTGQRKAKHLFVIVDESITGHVLSLNGFSLPTTPFLKANAHRLINFGNATSFTNFSAGSNLSIMSGMQPHQLPDQNYTALSKPGLFQFARKAGYKTFLLDGQSTGKLQNYTTREDLAFIDSIIRPGSVYPEIPLQAIDSVVAAEMARITEFNEPTFTYVNKAGAHWPYGTNYPSEKLTGLFAGNSYPESACKYFRSVYWNVDRFWQHLTEKISSSAQVLIIYTSDHGENYAAPSYKIKHASIYNAGGVEGEVPLFVWDRAAFFPGHYPLAVNRYAHRYIFPTLLVAMGYSKDSVLANYGRTLLDPPYGEKSWFQTGDLFGRGRNYQVSIDKE